MKAHFLQVKLTRCDFDNTSTSPKGMVRLMASGNIFYFNEEDFANAQTFLKRLRVGDELKICAELLKDGSFWVHWIYHSTKGRLEPERMFTLTTKQKKWLLISLICALISGGWIYISLLSLDFDFFIVVSTVIAFMVFIGGISYIGEKAYRYFRINMPNYKKRMKALDCVIEHQDALSSDNIQLIIPKIKAKALPAFIPSKKPSFKFKNSVVKRVRGKIKLHKVDRISIQSRNTNYSMTITSFQIEKQVFTLSYRDRNFYSDHNLFMADGDDIELFYCQENPKASPVIVGVYNHTDSGAYVIAKQLYIGHSLASRSITFVFGATSAFIFSLMAFFSISDVYERGGYWDKWDWLEVGNTFLNMGIIYFTLVTGIIFLTFLLSNFYIMASDTAMGCYQTYYLLKAQRFEDKQPLYVTELSQ